MADADRLVAALRYQQEMEDASRPVTVNPLMARKAEAIKQNAPAENMLTQYAETMPQNWQQFGQNMAQAYPTPATGASREQILGAVTQAAMNAGPLMTVYHGSPHRFDKFDASKIGTGEGAQAYGHGLYFAESPGVAADYQRKLSPSKLLVDGVEVGKTRDASGLAKTAIGWRDGDIPATKKMLEEYANAPSADAKTYRNTLDWITQNEGKLTYERGSLYKVDLPDEQIAKMLDWDKPLNKQAVYEQLKQSIPYELMPNGSKSVRDLISNLGGDAAAAEKLRAAGIPGIRYLDGGSRAGGAGTSNFVVFPGNEGLLKILDRK